MAVTGREIGRCGGRRVWREWRFDERSGRDRVGYLENVFRGGYILVLLLALHLLNVA